MIRLTIENDIDTENPLEHDGWSLYSFNNRHNSFKHPQEFQDVDGSWDPGLRRKMLEGLAFVLSYYEHGNCCWSRLGQGPQCDWDNVPVAGLLVWETDEEDLGPTTFDERVKSADQALDVYTDWCNGACYRYQIDLLSHCEHCHSAVVDEDLGSCGGFVGSDYMFEEIREILDEYPQEEVKVVGAAKDLADYEELRTSDKSKPSKQAD